MINQNYIVEMIVNQVNEEMTKQISTNGSKINLLDASRDLKNIHRCFIMLCHICILIPMHIS